MGHGLGVKCPRYQGLWQVGYWGLEFLGGSLTHPCPYPFSTGGAWSPWGPRSGEWREGVFPITAQALEQCDPPGNQRSRL